MNTRNLIALFVLTSLVNAAPAAGAREDTRSPDSTIAAVTVHPDGTARVEREAGLDLDAGTHRRRIALPAAVREESVTAAVKGEGVRIQAVRTTREPAAESPAPRVREIREELEAAHERRAMLADDLAAVEDELSYVRSLANLPEKAPEAFTERLAEEGIIARLQKALKEQGPAVRSRRRDTQARIDKLDDRIERLKKRLEQLRDRREPQRTAVVTLRTADPVQTRLRLQYRVDKAHWEPVYVARLDTEAPKLTLERRARVRQATGEDWEDVALALSTATPVAGEAPTDLETWWIDLRETTSESAKADRAGGFAASTERAMQAEAPRARTSIDTDHYAATYRLGGPVSLVADNQPATYDIAVHQLSPELLARVVPQRSERAWLTAVARLDAGEVLPGGSLRRFRDGRYLGEGRLASWPPGTKRTLGFGTDPALEVAYTAVADEAGEAGWISKETRLTRRYRLELTNRHDFSLPVSLRYRLPVRRNEEITVAPWAKTPEPDERDVNGQRGVLGWRFELAADEARVVPLGFEVRFPKETELQGL